MNDPSLAQLIGEVVVILLQLEAAARRRTIRRRRSITLTFDSGTLGASGDAGNRL